MDILDQEYLDKYKQDAWIQTYTGRKFYPMVPRQGDLTIFDIAHALGNKCRYGGHTAKFYSVAEHCVALALLARHLEHPVELQYQFLMHDAAEAYFPDIPRPVKHFFPEIVMMERALDGFIRDWAGLPVEVPAIVKDWDARIIRDERDQLMIESLHRWQIDDLAPLGVQLHGFDPQQATLRFLQAYQHISSEYLGVPTLCSYSPGEFLAPVMGEEGGETAGKISSDRKEFKPVDYRMLDLRGGCGMYANAEGYLRFHHGNFELRSPAA
jgi:hypothetical protein